MATAGAEQFGVFDFGLTEEQEARAARLHAESIVVDMLFQGPCGYRVFTPEMEAELQAEYEKHQSDLQYVYAAMAMPTRRALRGDFPDFQAHWAESGVTAGNRQVVCGFSERFAASWAMHTGQFDSFPWLVKARSAVDFRRAKAEGKQAGYVS